MRDFAQIPVCPHGPMLLFERFVKDKGSRKFFACSCFRDRKVCWTRKLCRIFPKLLQDCDFFVWADEAHKPSHKQRIMLGLMPIVAARFV